MADKRIKPRMHRRIPVSVELSFRGSQSGNGKILEMSEGGLSFTTSSKLAAGDLLELMILDDRDQLQIEGTVVYATVQEGEQVFGFQFGALTKPLQEQVRAFLKRHRFRQFRNPLVPAVQPS